LKVFLILISTIVLVLVVFGIANANFLDSFMNNLGSSNNSGTIPESIILLLISTGIVGYLGVRRK